MFLLSMWIVRVSYSFLMGKGRNVPEPETRTSLSCSVCPYVELKTALILTQ